VSIPEVRLDHCTGRAGFYLFMINIFIYLITLSWLGDFGATPWVPSLRLGHLRLGARRPMPGSARRLTPQRALRRLAARTQTIFFVVAGPLVGMHPTRRPPEPKAAATASPLQEGH
jgi:hypothetical protein